MKIALYKSIEYGYIYPKEVTEWINNQDDYVKISESIDVEFEMIPDDQLISIEVKKIDGVIENIKNEALEKISELQVKKSELLALTAGN